MKLVKPVSWNIAIPLVTNSFIVYQTTILCLVTGVVMSLLLGFILIMQGELSAIPQLLGISGIIVIGLWILMMLIMIIVFGNKMPVRFTINKKGITAQMTSPIGKKANRLAVILGLLMKKPGVAGSGLIALSQESVSYDWKNIVKVKYDRQKRQILMSNSWRPLVAIHCLPENFEQAESLVKSYFTSKLVVQNPVPTLFLRTILVFLATVPILMLDYPFKIDLFLPIFIFCFAQATIWLVPLFGYIVIFAVLLTFGTILWQGFTIHQSTLSFLGSYRGFELLQTEEWLGLVLAFGGMMYLIWMSWRAIKGKYVSALFAD